VINNCQIENISFSSLRNPAGCITSAMSYLLKGNSPEDTLPQKTAFDRIKITNFVSLKFLSFYALLILLTTYRRIYTSIVFSFTFIKNHMSGSIGNINDNGDINNNDNKANDNSNSNCNNLNNSNTHETSVEVNESKIATDPANTTHQRDAPITNNSTTTDTFDVQKTNNTRAVDEFDDSMRELIHAKEDYLHILTCYQSMADHLTKNPNPLETKTTNAETENLHFNSTAEEFIASQIELITQVRRTRITKDDSLRELQNLQKIFKNLDEAKSASPSFQSGIQNNNPVILFKKDSALQNASSKANSSNVLSVTEIQNTLAQEEVFSSAKPSNAHPVAQPQSHPTQERDSSNAGLSNTRPMFYPKSNPTKECASSNAEPTNTRPAAQPQNNSASGDSLKINPSSNL
jgi:hypothetical protein